MFSIHFGVKPYVVPNYVKVKDIQQAIFTANKTEQPYFKKKAWERVYLLSEKFKHQENSLIQK